MFLNLWSIKGQWQTYKCIHLAIAIYYHQWEGIILVRTGETRDISWDREILSRLVCERQTPYSSSSGRISGCFSFFSHIIFHIERYDSHKTLRSWLITNRESFEKLDFFSLIILKHTRKKFIIDIFDCVYFVLDYTYLTDAYTCIFFI